MRKPQFQFRSTVKLLDDWGRVMPRQMGYDEAGGKEHFKQWQARARRKLRELLGFMPATVTEPQSWLLGSEPAEGFTREHWAVESPFGDHIFLYRLVPDGMDRPRRILLTPHGHGYWGADFIAGINKGRFEEEAMIVGANYDYGAQFARRGYLVYAHCQRGFNQRCDVDLEAPGFNLKSFPGATCKDINARAILLGTSDIGLRVQDAMHLVGWIKSRPGEGRVPLGCVGLSGGGHTTEYLAALDPRVAAASIQGYFCYWTDQIMAHTHCDCNYVPNLLRYFEQDDVCALICPRPLLVTTADEDEVAPLKSFNRAYRALRQMYRDQGAEDRLSRDVFHGGHAFTGRRAFGFFDRYLAE